MDWPSFMVGMMAGGVLMLLCGVLFIYIDPDWF